MISKKEYKQLKKQSEAYRNIAGRLFEAAISDPVEEVILDFRKTGLYSKEFLKDLELGLKKSSYTAKRPGKKR